MQSGNLASEWKMTDVTPIFQKGKKTNQIFIDQVSLTSTSCRLLKTTIRDDIKKHLEENNQRTAWF